LGIFVEQNDLSFPSTAEEAGTQTRGKKGKKEKRPTQKRSKLKILKFGQTRMSFVKDSTSFEKCI